MMKLTLTTKFKSLEPFAIDLPDFVILTGINGAGKTQLLTAILNNQLRITEDSGLELNQIKYVTSQTLSPNESAIVTREQLNANTQNLLSNYNAYMQNKSNNSSIEIEIPRWYLHYQGHELEKMFVNAFPKLNEIKKGKEALLKMAIIEKIIDDIPELIPVDLLDIYSKLQITV